MYHFFVQAKQRKEDCIYIEGSDVNHIKNVLRMKVGDKLTLTDEDGVGYTCSIKSIDTSCILVDILEVFEVSHELPARITLFQGLPKSDKFELIIQKMVELGVHEIVPIETSRCVVKFDDKKKENKVKRWNKIAESAAKQSKRTYIPKVRDIMTFSDAVKISADYDLKCIPYENAEGMKLTKTFLNNLKKDMKIAFFIGPEGGFEASEIEMASKSNLEPISLGKRVLRTETAGIALMSMIMMTYECKYEE